MNRRNSEVHLGKPLSEMGHKPDCRCCICKTRRGETKGHLVSDETRERIRVAKLGSHHSAESNEKNRRAHLGKKQSEESKIKSRRAQLGKPKPKVSAALKGRTYDDLYGEEKAREIKAKRSGERNCNWAGGLSRFPYPLLFNNDIKKFVRERDSICQLCGKTKEENGQSLSIHHIDYDKENLATNNLTALCRSCNSKVNKNREYWSNYFLMRWILVA
ncbi:MAG TPA: HNH endonuclease [Sedimentisphaerales bacterium]|nr:HNH endonuclease [Sedimentisphaerales bacterium]